jgi:L-malate glycosyltransferase
MLLAPSNAMVSRRFLHMLLGAGHEVIYLDKFNPCLREQDGYIYIPYSFNSSWLNWIRPYKLQELLQYWWRVIRLRLIWQKSKPDIVHVHGIDTRAYYCALARLHPLILTAWGSDINDLFPVEAQASNYIKKIIYALRSANHITADTQELLTKCSLLAGRQLSASIFYYGIDLDIFRPLPEAEIRSLRQNMGISLSTRVILSVRRLIPKMCHEQVLEAFSIILKSTKFDMVLAFREVLGRDSKYIVYLKQQAQKLGVSQRVVWMDEVDYKQMPAIYNIADVIVNFPKQDGLPVSLFEAAACMKPVITSNLPAYQEFLSGGAYLQVPVGDVANLVETMRSVLEVTVDLEERLQKNYQLIIEKANQNKCFLDIEQVYYRVAGINRNVG